MNVSAFSFMLKKILCAICHKTNHSVSSTKASMEHGKSQIPLINFSACVPLIMKCYN